MELCKTMSNEELLQGFSKIEKWFTDKLSKDIYYACMEWNYRLAYYADTNQTADLGDFTMYQDETESLERYFCDHFLNTLDSQKVNGQIKPLIIYGAGKRGIRYYRKLCRKFKEYRPIFCDKRPLFEMMLPIPLITPEELFEHYKDACVVIAVQEKQEEIASFLIEHGIKKEQIYYTISLSIVGKIDKLEVRGDLYSEEGGPLTDDFYDILQRGKKEQVIYEVSYPSWVRDYFDPNLISFEEDEVFVDAGVFDGGSSVAFHLVTGGRYKKMYLFEPDPDNQKLSTTNLKKQNISNFQLFQHGLWDKKEELTFYTNQESCSSVIFQRTYWFQPEEIKVSVDAMDELLKDVPSEEIPTFIKMDIEGAELNALKGAAHIIKKYKPKLAISLYHKPEDIVEIPVLLNELVPEYRFFLRHYCENYAETVLYAMI